jgi:hypothetical protein
MRPPVDETAIDLLRHQIPEFEAQYLDLLDIYDEDLTAEVVFTELADYVTDLLVTARDEEVLERCFEAIDEVARAADDGRQLVAFSFLVQLSDAASALARPFFGPVAADIADRLERSEDIEPIPTRTESAP